MAHKVYEVEIGLQCPRCGNTQARLAVYHFGNTYTAECAGCAWGAVDGANEAQATARYRGKLLESGALPRTANAEAHGRAVKARTVQPLVGSLDGDK